MNYNDIFKNAYLKQLNIISENQEILTDKVNDITEADLTNQDGMTDVEIDTANDTDDTDDTNEVKQICFKTTDPVLIDALNSGFEEVVFFVHAKDEETGEDKIEEVKFGEDSFGDIEVIDIEDEEDDEIETDNIVQEDPVADVATNEADVEAGSAEDGAGTAENEVGNVSGDDALSKECKTPLNECNKLLASIKAKRQSKYGPY